MAHETVTKSQRFYCVSVTPDICKTPVGNSVIPIPYTITGEFKDAQDVSRSVKMHSEPAFLHGKSFIPSVKGDERGTVGGIKSGTYLKRVQPKDKSSTKGANGTQTVQESRFIWMNDRNTFGRIYERGVQGAKARLRSLANSASQELKDAAQHYKDNVSGDLHAAGQKAMDVGGDIATGSAALGVTGLAVGATGIGAPAAAVMETGAAAGGVVGGTVAGTGYAADTAATVLDHAADFVLTGKTPPVLSTLGDMAVNAAENLVLKKVRKIPFVDGLLKKLVPAKKGAPGSTPPPPKKPPAKSAHNGGDKDGHDGGKTKQKKEPKADKPSDCCPKDSAPGGKPVKSNHPVHYGTGEEILAQTDFVIDGAEPLAWTRVYRSGSECEDWGLLGARWSTPYTSSLSVCAQGIVYHEASGRALRLPALAIGQQHDHRAEGFILRRDSDRQLSLVWRDGSTDTFTKGPDGWLPHGYDGVNAMLAPGAPLRVQRFCLSRREERDGKGTAIERRHDARPGEVLLRIRTDDGVTIEALRDGWLPLEMGAEPQTMAPRIGRIEQVLPDGSRLCHVRYRYEADMPDLVTATAPEGAFEALPLRCGLVEQTNLASQSRSYAYHHHLLVQYTTYGGFQHGLEWVSLDMLRERWAGNGLEAAQLAALRPITAANSYQARAVRTTTQDGRDEVQIAYIDNDTTRVTEPDGGILEYRFNARWLATEVHRIHPDGSVRPLGRRQWDRDGMLLADIDADGAETRYGYDAAGNLTSVTDAQNHVTRIDYDANHLPVAVTDALGHTTRSRYDDAGRLLERTDALNRSTRYAYDAQGRLATVTDARGGNKRLTYDAAGRLAAYTDCSNYTTRYGYDVHGRLTEFTDAAGNTTRYHYDALGRMVRITYPDQTAESYDYDAEGNLVAHTDAKGHKTRYRYDGHGLLTERIDAKEQTLRYAYDKALRVTELVNGNGDAYLFGYDAESRLASETGFDGKTTAYFYSKAGHLIASDSAGIRTEYARDALGRLLAKSSADGGVRYAYDAVGRLIATATSQAEHRFMYDAAGQLIDERAAYSPSAPRLPGQPAEFIAAFTMTHAYDELGNRIQTILPNGRRIDTLRYGSGHWHGTLWQGTPLVDLERDQLHRETRREWGTAKERLVERRSYDPQSRLSAFTLEKGSQHLRERHYEYDAVSNLVHIDDKFGHSIRYTYDPLGQLLSAVQPGLTETFAFDPAGNLLDPAAERAPIDTRQVLRELDEQPAPGTTPPRLAKVTHNLLRQYMGYAYEYDTQGNTIVKRPRLLTGANDEGVLEFSYDTDNRLITAVRTFANSRMVARYSYDAFGRRIAKRVDEQRWEAGEDAPPVGLAHTGVTTLFVWDGDVMVQEVHADKTITYVYEPDSFVPLARVESWEGIASFANRDTHVWSVNTWTLLASFPDANAHVVNRIEDRHIQAEFRHHASRNHQLASIEATSAFDSILYYQCDHLGTPSELIDREGEVFWAAHYRAWGKVQRYDVNRVEQPLRFQGQYLDQETSLHYNRFRYYDVNSARYITQDPIGLFGGINTYQYASNSTGWIDPLGLAKLMELGTYGNLNGAAHVNDGLQAHELVRHEYLVQKGLANKKCRDADNPSIALDLDHHTRGPEKDSRGIGGAHYHEGRIRLQQGLGRNEFHPDTKRELDITQGGLRKAGIPASRARKLRKQAEEFLREQSKCRTCTTCL
ncbi:hypothetical protein GCM10027277_23890 [Pseudoduganella ginsengisoli]|uniref:DUF4150 domain-containing protein n=1 Tax=Pseudoduganella ginsengisoli TaxID=1462440 RepID=A0A6L6PZB1_9BURK|nr:RHS repeat-associated core domain-containing protein [Pseudoduganella ginsengisoli]MTW02887.1 DUF4150 domain-containing protein [Pseudoduganella ginsengisoli]